MINNIGTAQRFETAGKAVEVLSEYTYEGQVVTPDPKHEAEIIRRIIWDGVPSAGTLR